jgi:hypothetical protein
MHRDLHVALKAELKDRGLPPNRRDEVIDAAFFKINKRPHPSKARAGKSPYELGTGAPPPYSSLHFLSRLLYQPSLPYDPSVFDKYKPGDRVLYKHPNQKIGKLDDICQPYVVIKSAGGNGLVYQIKAEDPFASDTIIAAHVHDLKPNLVPPSSSPATAPPQAPRLSTASASRDISSIKVGSFLLWQDPNARAYSIGKVLSADLHRKTVRVQQFGVPGHLPVLPLSQRSYQPGWDVSLTGQTVYQIKAPDGSSPSKVVIPLSSVITPCFKLLLDETIPPEIIDQLTHRPQAPVGAALLVGGAAPPAVNYLACLPQGHVYAATAKTHQDIEYKKLTQKQYVDCGPAALP